MAGKIGAAISARGRSGAVPPGGYCYLTLGPIDQPDWTFAIAGDELPLTAISWRVPSTPAVFFLSVAPLDRERAQNEDGREKRGDHQAKD